MMTFIEKQLKIQHMVMWYTDKYPDDRKPVREMIMQYRKEHKDERI